MESTFQSMTLPEKEIKRLGLLDAYHYTLDKIEEALNQYGAKTL